MVEGYGYNAYLNTSANELVVQLDTVLCNPTNIYIAADQNLAVTLSSFTASGGDRVDTLFWRTESEHDNMGFHLMRRIAPSFMDSLIKAVDTTKSDTALESIALLYKRKKISWADTNWFQITTKLIPGAPGGTSYGPRDYRYLDQGIRNNILFEYTLISIDFSRRRERSGIVQVMPKLILPTRFMLYHHFPNPMKQYTFIRFDLPKKSKVALYVYNLKGQLVHRIIKPEKIYKPGRYKILWNCRSEEGRLLSPGQYILRFRTKEYGKTKKMIVIR